MDDATLRLTLRAELAEFKNDLSAEIDKRVATRASAEAHDALAANVHDQEARLTNVETWRNRLIGATAVCIFLSGFALEIGLRHYIH